MFLLFFRGSAFAVVLSQWTSAILHVVLIVYKGYHTDTWKGRVPLVKIIIINMRKLIQIIQKMKVVKINSTWLTWPACPPQFVHLNYFKVKSQTFVSTIKFSPYFSNNTFKVSYSKVRKVPPSVNCSRFRFPW